MDIVIAAIVIVVVTGVLIALVRRRAAKPLPKPNLGGMDAVDLDMAESSLARTIADIVGSDSSDAGFGH